MAWASIGSAGSVVGSRAINQSSCTFTVGASGIAAGIVAVVFIACDNFQTTDGDEGAVTSITDSGGNTWTKAVEFCNGQGASQAGCTISVWYSQLVNALNSGDTIVANLSNNAARDATVIGCWRYSANGNPSVQATATLANDASAVGSLDVATPNAEFLRVRAIATEFAPISALTPTSGWTAGLFGDTVVGSQGGMGLRTEFHISTGTSDVSNPTTSSQDHASVYIAFKDNVVTPTGLSATGAIGSLVERTSPDAGTGASVSGSIGSLAQSLGANLIGVAVAGAIGVFSLGIDSTANISGVSAAGGVGNFATTDTEQLTSVSATGSLGSLGATPGVTLSGLSATGSFGSYAKEESGPLAGVSASGSLGTLAAPVIPAFSGQSASGSVGSFSASAARTLTGVSGSGIAGVGFYIPTLESSAPSDIIGGSAIAEFAIGELGTAGAVANQIVGLANLSATGAVGSFAETEEGTIAGLSASASPGSFAAALDVPLAGLEATGAADSLADLLVAEFAGVEGIGAAGALTDFAVEFDLSGFEATADVGVLFNTGEVTNVSLVGIAASGAIGSLPRSVSLDLSGFEATGTAGSLDPAQQVENFNGVESQGSAGAFADFSLVGSLDGLSGSGELGAFAPTGPMAVEGFSALGDIGALAFASDATLASVSGIGAVGSFLETLDGSIDGVEAAGAFADLTPDVEYGLTGVSATGFFASTSQFQLGNSGSVGEIGSLVETVEFDLAGLSAAGDSGVFPVFQGLTGQHGTGAIGGFTFPSSSGVVIQVGSVTVGSLPAIAEAAIGEVGADNEFIVSPRVTVTPNAPEILTGTTIDVPALTVTVSLNAPEIGARHRRIVVRAIAS